VPAEEAPSRSLIGVLEESRALGFLGPGPVVEHARHALAMAEFVGPVRGPVLDLGAGGGVPGLVLAECWPEQRIVLLDAMHRRCEFLVRAADTLGLATRVTVVEGRAELVAREAEHREAYGLVVARAFGSPAVTAECAVGFLRPDGRLVVSEPPDVGEGRWPAQRLDQLGLSKTRTAKAGGAGFVELSRLDGLDPRWPRRTGVPGKRPLW
jgi:16S rRNA (guanine527-N7)-methyltransferase